MKIAFPPKKSKKYGEDIQESVFLKWILKSRWFGCDMQVQTLGVKAALEPEMTDTSAGPESPETQQEWCWDSFRELVRHDIHSARLFLLVRIQVWKQKVLTGWPSHGTKSCVFCCELERAVELQKSQSPRSMKLLDEYSEANKAEPMQKWSEGESEMDTTFLQGDASRP